ncbi:MAG: fibronectin type III domain-containing protein [Polyangiales bacterium]
MHCSSSQDGTPAPTDDSGTDDTSTPTEDVSPDVGDETLPSDHTPPTFGGITMATGIEESKVAVTWDPASDDTSPVTRIAYRVYASAPGGSTVDYSAPIATSVSGATSVKVLGLTPGASYVFGVRAVDEAGNEDKNEKTATASTTDSTPPKFGGVLSVKGVSASTLQLSWNPASDNGSAPSQIKYRVFLSATAGMYDFKVPQFETLPGTTTVNVAGLLEAKTYFAVVHAVDAAGNEDGNLHEVAGATLDKTPPTFTGLQSATAIGTSISLSWSAATDNVDPSAYIAYDIYRSKGSAVTDFTTPIATVTGGTTGYTFSGLDISTNFHFVVRARDSAGNRDGNTIDKSATTAASPDVKAPTFAGLVSATAKSASTIDLQWAAATDDYTPAASILYDIFVANSAGAEDFTGSPIATVTGDTTYTLKGLKPNKPYFVVVRARDTAGNRDTNTVEKTATTPFDTTRPTFGGLTSATSLGPTQIQLQWSPATDDVSLSSAIVYRVFLATATGAEVYGTPSFTTTPGVTTYVVNGLTPNKPYFFVVRAVDESGLSDVNTTEKSATTDKDTTAPTFGGLSSLTVLGPTSMVATWSAATYDVAPSVDIVYDLFVASASGAQDFTKAPAYTTAPGATSYTITGLKPKQNVFLVVRARDPYGNSDANKIEKGATTPADTTPPTFAGATNVSGATATTLTVNWAAATDDVTVPANIKYLICKSLVPTGCDGAGFFASASVTGVTSYQFTGLTALKDYYFRVRAQDEVPLLENNTVVVSGKTVNDTTKPTFGGCTGAVPAAGAAGASTLTVSWAAGSDDVSAPAQLVYDVWTSLTGPFDFTKAPDYSSAAGALSLDANLLTPNKKYYFVCRARDAAGNRDTNTTQVNGTTTADTTPPTFGGVTSATALSDTSVQIFWTAATDNATQSANIDYLICWWIPPATSCATTFNVKATVTGVTSYNASGLLPSTSYSFMVRARDQSLKIDGNTVSKSATTQNDTTDPIFNGTPTASTVIADTVASAQSLDLSWTAASDASPVHYEICATTDSSATSYTSCAAIVSASKFTTVNGATSFTLTGLSAATTYYVSMRAVDQPGNIDGGAHSTSAPTATSYNDNITAVFSGASSSGGCSGCHTWTRASTYNVPRCGEYYVWPGFPNNSVIYEKMMGTHSATCPGGVRMPASAVYNSTFQTWMYNWIAQGAHNN